jgi:hypothetical protein
LKASFSRRSLGSVTGPWFLFDANFEFPNLKERDEWPPHSLPPAASAVAADGRQREVDACTASCQPEGAVKFAAQELGIGKLTEIVGLCVVERNLPSVKRLI